MTVFEKMYQTFCFGSVTYHCKETLTRGEHNIYVLARAGQSAEKICKLTRLTEPKVISHIENIKRKGWL